MEPTLIRRRYDARVSARKTADQMFEYIEKYVAPFRGKFFQPQETEHEIEWRKREIYSGVAPMAAQILSASIQGGLTSASIKWFRLRFRQDALNDDNAAMEWLEDCENKMYQALQDSNFDTESAEFYFDLTTFATGAITEEVIKHNGQWEGLNFKSITTRDFYFEDDVQGKVINFYRRLQWTPLQIVDFFGEEATPDDILKQMDNPDVADTKHEIIFCIYKRMDKKDADISKKLAEKERPYGYKYIVHKDSMQIGEEGGYYEQPAFVARWRKVSGSQWGHGPAHVCMGDILSLNQLIEDTFAALGKVIDPATMVTERGLLSDLDLESGGLTVVRNKESAWAYESKAKFDVGEIKIDRMEATINRAFYIDQLQLKESPAMTAAEVRVRYELMQRILGPTYGRLKDDFLDPTVFNTFSIMSREGRFLPPPQSVIDSRAELNVEYTGPLARAQKLDEVGSVQAWVGDIAAMVEIFPEITDIPDADAVVRGMGMDRGVPSKYAKDVNEVKVARQARREKMEARQKAEQLQAEGDAVTAAATGEQIAQTIGQPDQ